MRVGTCQPYASTEPLAVMQGVQEKLEARAKELQGKVMFARHSSSIHGLQEAAPTSSGGDIEGEESNAVVERLRLASCLREDVWAHRVWPYSTACNTGCSAGIWRSCCVTGVIATLHVQIHMSGSHSKHSGLQRGRAGQLGEPARDPAEAAICGQFQ